MSILLAFTGDLFLGDHDGPRPFSRLAGQLGPQVVLVLGFEGTLHHDASALTPARPKVLLTSPSALLDEITPLPVGLACVGNNHINDYGNDIAQLTIDLLSSRFPTFGAGYSNDPFHLTVRQFGDIRVGFAAYCTSDPHPIYCTPTQIGPRPPDEATVREDARFLKEHADHSCAIMHWSDEYSHYPKPSQRRLGRMLIDAGFGLVVGGHSHTVQGYETYRDCLIFHSLGHFVFPDFDVTVCGRRYMCRFTRRCRWGIIPVFSVDRAYMKLHTIRFITDTNGGGARIADSAAMRRRLATLCRVLAGPQYPRRFERLRRREAMVRRLENLAAREHKVSAVLQSCRRLLRLGGSRTH